MTKSMNSPKSSRSTKVATAAPSIVSSLPDDQCFDWPISIQDGVRKRVQVKFPIDMRLIREREKLKRKEAEKAGTKKGQRGEYVVTVTKGGQPQLAPAAQASRMTVVIVAVVFSVLLLGSIAAFVFFLAKSEMENQAM